MNGTLHKRLCNSQNTFLHIKNNLRIVDNHKTTLENDKKGESPIQYTTHLLAVSKGSSISEGFLKDTKKTLAPKNKSDYVSNKEDIIKIISALYIICNLPF